MPNQPLAFDFDQLHEYPISSDEPPAGIPEPPEFSAYNEATEGHRIERLNQAWGAACATVRLLSNRYQNHWEGAIVHLRDHKGTLQIAWRDEQSRVMFEGVIVGAWETCNEYSASHSLLEMVA